MSEQDHDRAAPRPLTPMIFFLLLVGVVLLAIGIWTGNGQRRPVATSAAPDSLLITGPADSAQVPAPLDITFSTRAPLRLTPMGWQAGGYHLHAVVDTTQLMPGTMDIRSLGQGDFTWRLASVQPGLHHVRLVWARSDHRTIPEGASDEIVVTVTGSAGPTQGQGLLRR